MLFRSIQGEQTATEASRVFPGGFNRPTPEQEAEERAHIEEIRKWRLALPRKRFAEAKKKFSDAGLSIDVVKFDDFTNRIDAMDDTEIDYCFELAKALGARAISCEPPVSKTRRLGAFAAKHRLRIGYHGHLSKDPDEFAQPSSWEMAYSFSKFNGINLDIGHYTALGGDAVLVQVVVALAVERDAALDEQARGDRGGPLRRTGRDRKSTRLNSSHIPLSRMPSSA